MLIQSARLMPGLIRSSQPVIFLGLPGRTPMTTTDWVRMPLLAVLFQSAETSLASTSFWMSGSRDRCTTSAFWPAITARAWSPEAP